MRPAIPLPRLVELEPAEHAAPAQVAAALAALPSPPSPEQQARLGQFVALLEAGRAKMSLTAIAEPAQIWQRLVLDALLLREDLLSLPAGARVVDVGCGAGLPGLPLAITLPDLRFTLVDATEKKILFVRHVAEQLQIGNVEAVAGRAEVLTASRGGRLRERFDFVTARAVAPLCTLLELTVPFAKAPAVGQVGGRLLLCKGDNADAELAGAERALDRLATKYVGSRRVETGRLLAFEKLRPTPVELPRQNGVPKRNPL